MESCIAPSEIPGVSPAILSRFGNIAEDLIYADFRRKYFFSPQELYVDDHNESSYLFFLKKHNPSLNLLHFSARLSLTSLGTKRPDLLIHSFAQKVYFEIKPNSVSGKEAGIQKLAILGATYTFFKLPYKPGYAYEPTELAVASAAGQIRVKLKTKLGGPGLILYQLCVESNTLIDLAALYALLKYVIDKLNATKGDKSFRPIDLEPAFAREGQLSSLGQKLGLIMAAGAGAVGWRYFWKAVCKRFALRGATSLALAAADGPLPIGDLFALGLTLFTVIDIIRYSSSLWAEAANLQKQGA